MDLGLPGRAYVLTGARRGTAQALVLSPAASYLTGSLVAVDGGVIHGL